MPDKTPLSLTPDQKAVVLKELRDSVRGLSLASQLLAEDKLTPELGKNVLSITEHSIAKVTQVTGIATESAAEIEDRYAKIRAANLRIRELEQQLGQQASAEHVKQGVASYTRKIRHWWRTCGLGHVASVTFSEYGHCEVTLACNLFGRFSRLWSETPVSDKEQRSQWLDSLRESGLVLQQDDQGELGVLDCDASRTTLCRLILKTFPSARITDLQSDGDRDGSFKLRDIKVYIYSLAEIDQLPMPVEDKH